MKPASFWDWLGPFILMAAFITYLVISTETGICQGESNCVREWLSALGGWAAAIVAIPTLRYLVAQVKESERFNRVSTLLTVEPIYNSAHHVWKLAGVTAEFASEYLVAIHKASGNTWEDRLARTTAALRNFIMVFEREEMRTASRTYGTYTTSDSLLLMLKTASEFLDTTPPRNEEHFEECLDTIVIPAFKSVVSSLGEIVAATDKTLRFSSEILDQFSKNDLV